MMGSASSYETSSALAANDRQCISRRSRQLILNSCDRAAVGQFTEGIIDRIRPKNFHESNGPDVIPETFTDTYRNVENDGDEWYEKLFVNDNGNASVQVLSANWEGCPH